jgi:hypothetical protein
MSAVTAKVKARSREGGGVSGPAGAGGREVGEGERGSERRASGTGRGEAGEALAGSVPLMGRADGGVGAQPASRHRMTTTGRIVRISRRRWGCGRRPSAAARTPAL